MQDLPPSTTLALLPKFELEIFEFLSPYVLLSTRMAFINIHIYLCHHSSQPLQGLVGELSCFNSHPSMFELEQPPSRRGSKQSCCEAVGEDDVRDGCPKWKFQYLGEFAFKLIPSGKVAIENRPFVADLPLKIVRFYSYVSFPEGTLYTYSPDLSSKLT